jgi:hypothetical protein
MSQAMRQYGTRIFQKIRNYWFAAISALVFGVALLAAPRLGAGWFWSLGNGLGFAALAGMIYLSFDTRTGGKIRAHQLLSYCASGFLLAHILWFLIGDSIVIEYAKVGAPWPMWSAWLALLLMIFLVISSLPGWRQKQHVNHAAFKRWHKLLTFGLLAASLHHIIGSGFYLRTIWQWGLITLIVVAALFQPARKSRPFLTNTPLAIMLVTAISIALFSIIRNLEL